MATSYEPVDGIEAAKNFAILRAEEARAESDDDAKRSPAPWIALFFFGGLLVLLVIALPKIAAVVLR